MQYEKKIDDPLQNDFGTLYQKTGLKIPWVLVNLTGKQKKKRDWRTDWLTEKPIKTSFLRERTKVIL